MYYSPNRDLDLGLRTFNVFKDVIVVDGYGYRRASLCWFLRVMMSIFKKELYCMVLPMVSCKKTLSRWTTHPLL